MSIADHIAVPVWRERHGAARERIRAGHWSPEEADARLRPWLAIALRAGARPDEAAPFLAQYAGLGLSRGEQNAAAADLVSTRAGERAALEGAIATASWSARSALIVLASAIGFPGLGQAEPDHAAERIPA